MKARKKGVVALEVATLLLSMLICLYAIATTTATATATATVTVTATATATASAIKHLIYLINLLRYYENTRKIINKGKVRVIIRIIVCVCLRLIVEVYSTICVYYMCIHLCIYVYIYKCIFKRSIVYLYNIYISINKSYIHESRNCFYFVYF